MNEFEKIQYANCTKKLQEKRDKMKDAYDNDQILRHCDGKSLQLKAGTRPCASIFDSCRSFLVFLHDLLDADTDRYLKRKDYRFLQKGCDVINQRWLCIDLLETGGFGDILKVC